MDEETLVTGTDDKNHGDLDNLDLYMNGPSNHATSSQADWPYDYFRFYFGPAPDWLVEHWASQYLLGAGDLPADMCSTPGAATQYSSSTVTVPGGLTGTVRQIPCDAGMYNFRTEEALLRAQPRMRYYCLWALLHQMYF